MVILCECWFGLRTVGVVLKEAQMVGSPGQIGVLVLKATPSQTEPLKVFHND